MRLPKTEETNTAADTELDLKTCHGAQAWGEGECPKVKMSITLQKVANYGKRVREGIFKTKDPGGPQLMNTKTPSFVFCRAPNCPGVWPLRPLKAQPFKNPNFVCPARHLATLFFSPIPRLFLFPLHYDWNRYSERCTWLEFWDKEIKIETTFETNNKQIGQPHSIPHSDILPKRVYC